jgi:hydrogenase maturation protease
MTPKTLVLGIGNILLRDDGVGVWVAEKLRRQFRFPESVTIVEGGTLGLDLLPQLDGVERLLIVDAVRHGRAPGELVRLEGSEVPAVLGHKISPHQVGVQDLLAAAQLMGLEFSNLVLWGIEPERLEPGTGFSSSVGESLPLLVTNVLEELAGWGLPGSPCGEEISSPIWWVEPHQ